MEDWQKDLQGNSESWGSNDWGSPNWGEQAPNGGEQITNHQGVSEHGNWQGGLPPQNQSVSPHSEHQFQQGYTEQTHNQFEPQQPMTDEQLVEIHNRPFLHRLGLTLVGIFVVALAGFLIWEGVTLLAHKTPAEKALIEQQKVEQSLQQSIQEETQTQTATEQTQPSKQTQTPQQSTSQTSVSEQSSSQSQEQTSVPQPSSSQEKHQTSVSEVVESDKTRYTLDQIDPQVLENTAVVKEIFFQKENDLLATFEVTFEMGSTTLTLPMNFQDVNGLGQGDKVLIKYSKVIGADKVIIRSITR